MVKNSSHRTVMQVPFAATSDLRDSVLRPGVARPVDWHGLDGPDAVTFAVYADGSDGEEPVVTVSVVPAPCLWWPEAERPWQLRAMATATDWQGHGVGRLAVEAVVEHVRAAGGDLLWCNARVLARAFYERAGFTVEGAEFHVADIGPHWPMARPIPLG